MSNGFLAHETTVSKHMTEANDDVCERLATVWKTRPWAHVVMLQPSYIQIKKVVTRVKEGHERVGMVADYEKARRTS
ncbi:hypothetical protein J26TS2_07220 [Shouchella clausii]|nr:hypothetical protein J26TS2_07220 [Shouchella clausii]